MCKNKEAQQRMLILIKSNIDIFDTLSKEYPNNDSLGSFIRCLILDEIDMKK